MEFLRKLFSFDYYIQTLEGSTNFKSILTLFLTSVLLTIYPSYNLIKIASPLVNNLEKRANEFVENVYPEELKVEIKNGVATTNVTEPYYITIEQSDLENIFPSDKKSESTISKYRLLAIDTKGKAEDFERYQSLALLTENSLVAYDDKEIKIYPLREMPNLTVTKSFLFTQIKEWNQKLHLTQIISVIFYLLPLFIFWGIFMGAIFGALITSLFIWAMVKIVQIDATYKNIFRYGVLVGLIPTFIWEVLSYLKPISSYLYDTFVFIIILSIAYIGLKKLKSTTNRRSINHPLQTRIAKKEQQ